MSNSFMVLRDIIENNGSMIDELESKFGCLDVQELKHSNLIEESQGFVTVTEEGHNKMMPFRVDNAIIMAAGMGSRFVPYSYYTPKGLIEVNGVPLVERQIIQFRDAGIENIYIIVGYMGQQFEYLAKKYSVKIIRNIDFASKNNISSLYYANKEGILGNSYLTPSDIYIEKNVFHQYEDHSWYATKFFEGEAAEWGIECDDTGLINNVSKSAVNQEAMYGTAFLSKSFTKVLAEKIVDLYDDESFSQWYWEDVYIKFMNELPLYTNLSAGESVLEFECYEELREFDTSYYNDARNSLLDIICKELNCTLGDIHGITPLKVGMTNDSFKFSVKDADYVFRVAGEGTDVLIDRYAEAKSYEAIQHLNISDEIIYFDPKKGIKIAKYIKNAKQFTEEDIEVMISTIRKLHESEIEVEHKFDVNERIEYYFNLCESTGAKYYPGLLDHYDKTREIRDYVDVNHNELCFCHIDPIVLNFVWSDDTHHLLDWEYSAISDPYLDLAMIVLFSYLPVNETDELLKMYLEEEPSESQRALLYSYCSLVGVLWALWTQYKETRGETYGSYGMDQFKWSELYYDEFLKVTKAETINGN